MPRDSFCVSSLKLFLPVAGFFLSNQSMGIAGGIFITLGRAMNLVCILLTKTV